MNLALQKLKRRVIVIVVSKDQFEKRDNFEKINMEISGGVIWLDETWSCFAQILVSPADQCDLWKEYFLNLQRRQELQNAYMCFKNMLFSCGEIFTTTLLRYTVEYVIRCLPVLCVARSSWTQHLQHHLSQEIHTQTWCPPKIMALNYLSE